ncbi:MlaA family lipoprotein [Paraburkholderia metrosideri]|uniref:MlaA family lipoprotein n=1 Tax=Paraburkholderia metrosideri TaxID=580937 RepID=UPI0038B6CF3C
MLSTRSTGALAAALVLAGCAAVQTPSKADPYEGLNRTVFTLNDKIDEYALKPAAQAYVWALPQPLRESVTNFFSNIGDVYTAANDLLQLKITDGVPSGPYLVLLLLGPSTVRDTAGTLVEFETDLTAYIQPTWIRATLYGVRIVSVRASLIGASHRPTTVRVDRPFRVYGDGAAPALRFAGLATNPSGMNMSEPADAYRLRQKSWAGMRA